MIAVIIPVHNEEELLEACLKACIRAAEHSILCGEKVENIVVLDACIDSSAEIAKLYNVTTLVTRLRNVGKARALGAAKAICKGARWLAFADADSEVPDDWLSRQLVLRADAVCGLVAVKNWSSYSEVAKLRYGQHYQFRDGHRHIHGANLGISTEAYLKVGGFPSLPVHEDVAIIRALENSGASVAWVANPCVLTSGRKTGRLLGGFACYLNQLDQNSTKRESQFFR